MTDHPPLAVPPDGALARNVIWFARALRRAGLPIGPGRMLDAVRAVRAAGFTDRADFYWALHATLVTRPEHSAVFDQIFRLFWRDPRFLEHMMAMLSPLVRGTQPERAARPAAARASQALTDPPPAPPADAGSGTEIEIDARRTASADERLRTLDFEQMGVDEMARAKRILATLRLDVPPIHTRRHVARPGARADWRRTMAQAARRGGEIARPRTRRSGTRMPALVVLCDISGSMSAYSRAVLHFVHAVANREGQGWSAVHAFTFGTRLTNITRHLATRDVDAALAAAGAQAQDWSGGTRIAAALRTFNRDWSRRVTGQGAVVLLVTDGLDRAPDGLGPATERLALSARHLIWINPLLRFDRFAPRARGVAAMLPHVDTLRAGHDIASLAGLAAALSMPSDNGQKSRLMAMLT